MGGASWAIALGVATEVARPAYADRAAAQAQTARPKKGPAQVEGRSGARGGQLKRAALTTVMPQDTTPVVRIWEKKSPAQKKVKRSLSLAARFVLAPRPDRHKLAGRLRSQPLKAMA